MEDSLLSYQENVMLQRVIAQDRMMFAASEEELQALLIVHASLTGELKEFDPSVTDQPYVYLGP